MFLTSINKDAIYKFCRRTLNHYSAPSHFCRSNMQHLFSYPNNIFKNVSKKMYCPILIGIILISPTEEIYNLYITFYSSLFNITLSLFNITGALIKSIKIYKTGGKASCTSN